MDGDALIAVKEGNLEKVQELLIQGINIDAQDDNGKTFLHHAASNNQHLMVSYLLTNGANLFITDDQNYTALHIAVSNTGTRCASADVVKAICQKVARKEFRKLLDMKIKDSGNTALHILCKKQDVESCFADAIVVVLLCQGANFEITNDAGEKPVDVASSKLTRGLFKLIETSFAQAKNGNNQLISDLKKSLVVDFNAVMNCRNNEGRTIMQVALMNQHYNLSQDLLMSRIYDSLPEHHFEKAYRRDRMAEIEKLADKVEEYLDLCTKYSDAMVECVNTMNANQARSQVDKTLITFQKNSCQLLEKAHEVLLAYRTFSGEQTRTASAEMKTIEEIFELLGFDPDEPFVIVGEESCYYKKLPLQWKINFQGFGLLNEGMVERSINYYMQFLNNIRLIHAVIDDDVDKVKKLLDMELCSTDITDEQNDWSAICYAAKNGNEKIIRLLLQADATVVRNDAVSPVYLAAKEGHAKVVKMLLKTVNIKDIAKFIDFQRHVKRTALHAAAKKGHLDIVKILLSHGATYSISDGKGRTPADVSVRNKDVSDFLKLVDGYFHDAEEGNIDLIHKLKAMEHDELMAVVNTKNNEGLTLATAAAKANAKNIAVIILRMLKEAKQEEK